tara:strand:- start:11 stop:628 length:618 start_codon:yes stop_codon:yes gene_type:complete
LKILKIIILILFFSVSLTQEAGFFSKNKRGAVIFSVSALNTFNDEEFNTKGYDVFKIDYKSKKSFQTWVEALYDKEQDVYIGTFGLGYFFETGRKTMLTLYAEKNFYEKNYNELNVSNSDKDFYFKYGWIFYLNKQIPFYLKYTNEYKKTIIEDEFNKLDKILFGSFTKLNNLIIGYSINLNTKDFLNLNFKDSEISFSLGYRLL